MLLQQACALFFFISTFCCIWNIQYLMCWTFQICIFATIYQLLVQSGFQRVFAEESLNQNRRSPFILLFLQQCIDLLGSASDSLITSISPSHYSKQMTRHQLDFREVMSLVNTFLYKPYQSPYNSVSHCLLFGQIRPKVRFSLVAQKCCFS